jgi:peptidoglycan/xylan/chitin deacetylase (PgdA/CDA1 family)/GT2 family glycosyltransferase
MRISVVIPTYNRRDTIARTLPTVLEQEFPKQEYEVVVVVDGSTDGSGDLVRALQAEARLRIVEQPNRGVAAARNAGMRAAEGDLILFLDDDMLCEKTLLRRHSSAHRDGESLVVFGPVLVAAESRRGLATDWIGEDSTRYFFRLQRGPRSPCEPPVGPNCSLARRMLVACGGYDESFRIQEDAELALRMRSSRVQFRCEPEARTYQLYVKRPSQLVHSDAPRLGRSEIRLCRKHPVYRPYSRLAALFRGSMRRRLLLRMAACFPVSPEAVMGPAFAMADLLRPKGRLRRAGMRLLDYRMSTAVVRAAVRSAGSWTRLRAEFGMTLPVLLYHHVGPSGVGLPPELSVTPDRFEQEIRRLVGQGYSAIGTKQWTEWRRESKGLPAKPVVITFDHAYSDTAEYALRILHRYHWPAVVLVPTAYIGRTNSWMPGGMMRVMTGEQIRTWAAQGVEFGAQSRTHRDLTTLGAGELEEEIAGCKRELEAIAGAPVTAFAYPYGSAGPGVIERVRATFDVAFTATPGTNSLVTDPYLLHRTPAAEPRPGHAALASSTHRSKPHPRRIPSASSI